MSVPLLTLLEDECRTLDTPLLDNIENLQTNCDDWVYVDLKLHARRLNRILKSSSIRELYHYTTNAYASVRRWQLLKESEYTYMPGKWIRSKGPLHLPCEADSCDWRYTYETPGRKPLYWDYVCHSACHWMVEANLEVAKRLLPNNNWIIVSGVKHSTVLDPEAKLIFDMQYTALNVSEIAGLQLLFGENYDELEDINVGTASEPYKCTEGFAGPAMKLFEELDSRFADRPQEALKCLQDFWAEQEDAPVQLNDEPVIKPALTLQLMGA